MKRLHVIPEAKAEAADAVEWQEEARPGFGPEFRASLRALLMGASAHRAVRGPGGVRGAPDPLGTPAALQRSGVGQSRSGALEVGGQVSGCGDGEGQRPRSDALGRSDLQLPCAQVEDATSSASDGSRDAYGPRTRPPAA